MWIYRLTLSGPSSSSWDRDPISSRSGAFVLAAVCSTIPVAPDVVPDASLGVVSAAPPVDPVKDPPQDPDLDNGLLGEGDLMAGFKA